MLFNSRQMRAYHQPDLRDPPSAFKYYGKHMRRLKNMRACFVDAERQIAKTGGTGGRSASRPLLMRKTFTVVSK
jgi:ribosomal protein S17